MAQAPVLQTLYGELNRIGQRGEYEKAVKAANKILQQFPDESLAFHHKIVSLIFLDRYDDALTAIHKDKEKKLSGDLKFEKAYCQYRLNRTNEALTTLRSIPNPDNRCKELLAQVLYRVEELEECYGLYKDLIKNCNDDYDDERLTNMAAVVASLQMWKGEDMDDPGLGEDSYELLYNSACLLVGKGQYAEAMAKLRKAEDYLRKDQDLTEEELEDELAIVRVQMGYIHQLTGQLEKASQLYNHVQKTRPTDAGVMAVLSNNLVTINKDQNRFDSKRKLKVAMAMAETAKYKLVSRQKDVITLNQCLLHMHSNQADQCHNLAQRLQSQMPDLDTPVLIEAAQYVKDKNVDKAVEILQAFAAAHPESAMNIQLVMAQLYLSQAHVFQACQALAALPSLRHRPGVVSTLVTLYLNLEDQQAASEALVSAVNWYKANQPKAEALLTLTRANADFQMKMGNAVQASKMLEDMRKKNPKDPRILAQLISAYGQFDSAKAEQVSRDLPPVEEIMESVDVDSLEKSFSTLGPKHLRKAAKAEPSPGPAGDVLIQKKKRKKKRKGKLPKNYDASVTPDPERWLPRRERSYYRGKRKDKRKDIGKGTQGATGGSGDIDASKSATADGSPASGATASPQSPASSSASAPSQGPRQQRPAQANKKKKKKGNKW